MSKWVNNYNYIYIRTIIQIKRRIIDFDIVWLVGVPVPVLGVSGIFVGPFGLDELVGLFDAVEKITIIAALSLVVVTVFLIINTIKITIFSRKREISIMRLVGASNTSIRFPFLIEGMVLGLLGSIIPILMVIFGYHKVYNHFNGYLFTPLIRLIEPTPFIYLVSLIVLVIGIIVGMLGSYRAVKKYLKVWEN